VAAFDTEDVGDVGYGQAAEASAVFQAERRARILVIDDEALILRSVARTLSKHEVVTLNRAHEAIALLRQGTSFDLVLCDMMMPDVDGIQVFDTVTRERPDLRARFVFMTGGVFSAECADALGRAQARQLEKPFTAESIRTCVADVLDRIS